MCETAINDTKMLYDDKWFNKRKMSN